MKDTIQVEDYGQVITITFDACKQYHGPDRIAGLSMGFRLMKYALSLLSPDKPPVRSKISVKSAFPGPGFQDAVEMVSRAVTRHAYEILHSELVDGPEAQLGKMYFEVTYDGKTMRFTLAEGALTPEIVAAGRAALSSGSSSEEKAIWENWKQVVSQAVWDAEAKDLFVIQH